jgi:hypothetical protein
VGGQNKSKGRYGRVRDTSLHERGCKYPSRAVQDDEAASILQDGDDFRLRPQVADEILLDEVLDPGEDGEDNITMAPDSEEDGEAIEPWKLMSR